MITLGTEKLMSRSEVLGNIKKHMKTHGVTVKEMSIEAIILLAIALDEDSDFIRGALSGRFEVEA
jgi:hypothetical protein